MFRKEFLRAAAGCAGLSGCLGALLIHAPAAAQTQAAANSTANTIMVTGLIQPAAPNLFGTVALRAKVSRYADGWYRSRLDASSHPRLKAMIAPARGLPRDAQIAFVQRAVTQQIRWISDATEWGRHDYWASAKQTLDHGAGDMEDRAIVKLQALKALGVPGRDLYLTMGKDKVGGPITVLIVRTGNRYLVLDDTGGAPFAADRRPEFEPMLTFGANTSWIHGRRIANARAPANRSGTGAKAVSAK